MSSLYSDQDLRSGQHNGGYQCDENSRHKGSRVPERYGREEMGKEALKRDTSRVSQNSQKQHQKSSVDFYNKSNNQQTHKRQHNQERADSAKRPYVENKNRRPT